MELCIKTVCVRDKKLVKDSFNPCFNGTMYKNNCKKDFSGLLRYCFNPCFNGTMYKNSVLYKVSDSVISCFNPCFNGTMYKNGRFCHLPYLSRRVSILVLMELCIKTRDGNGFSGFSGLFQSLF